MESKEKNPEIVRFQDFSGGDKRDRTADLMTARVAFFCARQNACIIISSATHNKRIVTHGNILYNGRAVRMEFDVFGVLMTSFPSCRATLLLMDNVRL